jgi:hypothetical protein
MCTSGCDHYSQAQPEEALMSIREPQEMAEAATKTGAKKTQRSWDRVLVSAFWQVRTSPSAGWWRSPSRRA